MSPRFRFPLFSLLSWVALAGMPSSPVCARGADPDEVAQQAFRTGVDAARQEHWSEALAAFETAYGLSPRPVVLINLAGVQVRMGRLIEAAKNYRRIVNDPPTNETAAFKRAAAEVLPSLEARIPRVRLRATGLSKSDLVQIDGQPIEVGAPTLIRPMDPGEHTLIVQREGVERARVIFALAERELRDISLPLPGLLPGPLPASTGGTGIALSNSGSDPAPAAAGARRRWWASPWVWVLAGATVVGASVTAGVLLSGDRDPAFSGNVPPGKIAVR